MIVTELCVLCDLSPRAEGLLCEHCDGVYQAAAKTLEDLRERIPPTQAEQDHRDGMALDRETE